MCQKWAKWAISQISEYFFSETLNYLWRHRQRFRIWHDYDSLCEGISSIFQQFLNQETKERL